MTHPSSENIKAIGIRFSDNDFGVTVHHWLEQFVQVMTYRRGVEEYNKEKIVEIYNKTIGSFYLMYQADDNKDEEEIKRITNYLQIELDQVFLNEEVDNHLIKVDYWDNSQLHYCYGVDSMKYEAKTGVMWI